MSRSSKLVDIATAVGGFAASTFLLALVLYAAGFDQPLATASMMLVKIFGFVVLAVLIVLGLMVGKALFKSAVTWKKIAGALLFGISLAVGLSAASYIYSGAEDPDCPSGVPNRFC